MIYLSTRIENQNPSFFHTMDDCIKYMKVFEDHWCNVPWDQPREIRDETIPKDKLEKLKRFADKDPKERAEQDLSWGFSLCEVYGIENTAAQKAFVESFIAHH